MVKEDLDLLLAGGFKLIRLFDSSDKVAKQTLEVIRDNALDMKVMLGIYLISGDPAFSNAEIARGIKLANDYKDIVLVVSVGNETMVNWSFNRFATIAMRDYIVRVRNAVTQPVTTDDNWAFFAQSEHFEQDPQADPRRHRLRGHAHLPAARHRLQPGPVGLAASRTCRRTARRGDDGRRLRARQVRIRRGAQPPRQPGLHRDAHRRSVKPAGRRRRTSAVDRMRAHPVNQKMYFDRLQAWKAAGGTGPKNVFYFEAFDEPWKQGDDGWGLFNVKRQARFVCRACSRPPCGSRWMPADDDGIYTDSDAVYYIPPRHQPSGDREPVRHLFRDHHRVRLRPHRPGLGSVREDLLAAGGRPRTG